MMRSVVFIYIIFTSLLCYAERIQTLRIVGGESATDGEFPYMVSLRGDNQYHLCGGTIISANWILTAGHCVSFATFVRYGSVLLNEGYAEQTIRVKRQILHPLWYTDVIPYNDLGLLELEKPLIFDDFIQPINLPDDNQVIPFNYTGILSGWGLMENNTQTDRLQKVELTLFSDEYCESLLNQDRNYFNSSLCTCAGDWNGTKGQCSMDSGGPFVINGVQWGVVSWSFRPCGSLPGALTRLANPDYRKWIQDVTGVLYHTTGCSQKDFESALSECLRHAKQRREREQKKTKCCFVNF